MTTANILKNVSPTAEDRVARLLAERIGRCLSHAGLLFRRFHRAKSSSSLLRKIESSPGKYSESGKKIQDPYGVRIAVYFADDVGIVRQVLLHLFGTPLDVSEDQHDAQTFAPARLNFVFPLPEDLSNDGHLHRHSLVDQTFEVQVRSVLSEGWHEVEHDLRYKCAEDWEQHHDLWRALNGILATLETCDWSLIKLFDDVAYRHYKDQNWLAMIRTKFRIRLVDRPLSAAMVALLAEDRGVRGKRLFREPRERLLSRLAATHIRLPLTPENVIHIVNSLYWQDPKVGAIANSIVTQRLAEH